MKFEAILKYQEWYLCQISRTNHAARRIFNSLLGVSSGDETLHLMFDILPEIPLLLANQIAEISHVVV